MNDTGEQRELLWKLIKNIRFAMFTTRHDNGHLHARPMTTQNKALEADESLWFFMSKSGDPSRDLIADPGSTSSMPAPPKTSMSRSPEPRR